MGHTLLYKIKVMGIICPPCDFTLIHLLIFLQNVEHICTIKARITRTDFYIYTKQFFSNIEQ